MKTINQLSIMVFTSFIMGMFLLIPAEKSQAQILELDQKIFGMDCAPCAKGVENRMKRMNGIQKAELNLNEGVARLSFAEQNSTSLKQIQESIIDGGFSPKDARIKVQGDIQKINGKWHLTTESGDLFLIDNAEAIEVDLIEEQKTIAEGMVAERKQQEHWVLTINKL